MTVERNVNVDLIMGCPSNSESNTDEFLIVRLLCFAQTFALNIRMIDF